VTRTRSFSILLLTLIPWIVGCGDDRRRGPVGDSGTPDTSSGDTGGDAADAGDDATSDTSAPLPFALESSVFEEGGMIPLRYECGPPIVADGPGENITPPLSWTSGPATTMSYAIVMRDVDAGGLVHWAIYDIDAATRDIAEGVPGGYDAAFPSGAKQAELQGSGFYGYFGPCSPSSINTYQLTIHALDTPTLPGVDMTTSENDVAAAVEAASIASASLSGES